MKNRKTSVLPFPKLREQEFANSTIIAQIGSRRFAIYFQTEDLPPVEPPLLMPKRKANKAPSKSAK